MARSQSSSHSLGVAGLIGIAYIIVIALGIRKQNTYKPFFEDWLFHVLLPLAAYATLTVSALATRVYVREAPFGVAAAALLLLFIGIHDAWDIVTYHVFARKKNRLSTPRLFRLKCHWPPQWRDAAL